MSFHEQCSCGFPTTPISVHTGADSKELLVRLVYVNPGLRSVSSFARWLEERAEVIYTADTTHNFSIAEREFLRRFPALPFTQSVSICGYLLQHDYPVWGMKYRRALL